MILHSVVGIEQIEEILSAKESIAISEHDQQAISNCFGFLESFSKDKVIYGINTGFGPMAQWRIDDDHLKELQYNIIRSHSTGAGEPLPVECVRA